MYSVSSDYLDAMMSHGTKRRITGTIGNLAFTGDDIVQGTLEISNRCAEESKFQIGGVYVGQLEMSFTTSFLQKLPRDQYQGKDVSISIGLYIEDNEEWVDVPCGIFTLQSPKISKDGIAVTGYDYMKKLDKTFGSSVIAGSILSMLRIISTDCGVELGMTEQEINALPNADEQLSMYSENDVETYRDLLYWVAQTTGRFATINRLGQLELRKFGVPTGVEIDEMHRDIDVVFSGYTTHYTGISVVDIATESTKYYGLAQDDGLSMNLGSNPLVQYGIDEVVDRQRIAILNEIADIEYTPFSFASIRDPIFDLGDEIDFTGGLAGSGCTGCVMSYVYKPTAFEFEGFGDDPTLTNSRSKTDKNISGLMSKTESNAVYYYSYENIDEINLADTVETEIARIKFAAKKMTDVVVQCEFKINLENTAEADRTIVYHDEEIPDDPETPEDEEETVTTEIGYFDKVERPMVAHILYYYDDVLVDYQPVETWAEEGYHVFSGFYHLKNVTIDTMHEWTVKVLLSGANGNIDIKDSHLLISGQGLAQQKDWKGEIEASDSMVRYKFAAVKVVSFEEQVSISLQTMLTPEFEDQMELVDMGALSPVKFEDNPPSVVLRNIVFGFLTDDGDDIMTEDKQYYITTDLDE